MALAEATVRAAARGLAADVVAAEVLGELAVRGCSSLSSRGPAFQRCAVRAGRGADLRRRGPARVPGRPGPGGAGSARRSASARSSRSPSCAAIGRSTPRNGSRADGISVDVHETVSGADAPPESSGTRFALTRLPSPSAASRRRSPTQRASRCSRRCTPRTTASAFERCRVGPAPGARPAFGADLAGRGQSWPTGSMRLRRSRRGSRSTAAGASSPRGSVFPRSGPSTSNCAPRAPRRSRSASSGSRAHRELGRRPGSSCGPRFQPPAPCGPGGLGRGAGDAGSRSPT